MMRYLAACPKGPHYFVNNDPDKTHYKLYTPYLRQLVKYKLGGEKLESQADIPDDLRRELYAEADNATGGL